MGAAVDSLLVEQLLKFGAENYLSTSTPLSTGGSLLLTSLSNCLQYLTGSGTGFTVHMPAANTIEPGRHFIIANTTSNVVWIKDGAGNTLFQLSQNSLAFMYLQTDTTAAGYWVFFQILASSTASGIINYNLTSDTPFSTSSTTDVPITMFSLTPQAGSYAIWYNSDDTNTQNNSAIHATLYKNGTRVADSERSTQSVASNFEFQVSTMSIVQVNGTDAIDVRVRTSQGTLTVGGRSLLLIRLGT